MDKIKDRVTNAVLKFCIYAEVIFFTVFRGVLCGTSYAEIFRNVATVVVGIMIFVYYYSISDGRTHGDILPRIAFLVSFAASNALVAYASIEDIGTIWMIAIAIAAVRVGIDHAVPCHALLMLQYMTLVADTVKNMRIVIFYAITGILLALVMSEIRNYKEFIYASIIFVVLTAVMVIVLFNFDLEEIEKNIEFGIKCLVGDGMLLLIAWFTYCIKSSVPTSNAQTGKRRNQKRDKKALLELLEPDNMLLTKIKDYSEPLYSHSVRVGRLSYKAAYHMGCDCLLAQAGGLYHKAGKIYENKKYVESCKTLITKYSFPAGLSAIIMQYAYAEKPKSYESAIVMVSDSIISTDEYLTRIGKRTQIPDEKLVKSIFSKRIEKGNFSESGMDKEQIDKLMHFYINNAFKENL